MRTSSSPFSSSNRRRLAAAGACAATLPLLGVAAAPATFAAESDSPTSEAIPIAPATGEAGVQAIPRATVPQGASLPQTAAASQDPAPNVFLKAWWRLWDQPVVEFEFYLDIPPGADVFAGIWDPFLVHTLGWRVGNKMFFTSANETGGGIVTTNFYGRPTDEVLVGDWDGDGIDTVSIRRGNEFHINNYLYSDSANLVYTFGKPTDEVVVGDWDGDQVDTVMLRRGNRFLVNNDVIPTGVEYEIRYGEPGDQIIAGDVDGDPYGDELIAKRGREFHFRHTLTTGSADWIEVFGEEGDIGLLGDWNGDYDRTIGVYRPSTTEQCNPNWFWSIAWYCDKLGGNGL